MRIEWRIALIWACFLARLAFYATMLPLWEGCDEWAHFSVIRTMALRGQPLVARDQPVPRDVAASLQLAPVPWELRNLPAPSVTEDVYWSLPPEMRAQREATFRAMPAEWGREDYAGGLTAYEALQPPLYYWMMASVVRLMSHGGLAAQVLVIRWLGIAIASCIIPLVFRIGHVALGDERVALCCAAVVAVMPGLAVDVARVGNDCLAMVWFTLLIWIGLRLLQEGASWRTAAGLGVVLGLGLLTKAYFLTAVPAVVLLLAFVCWRRRAGVLEYVRASTPVIVAAAIAGWWYWRNILTTGTLSGLSEAAMLRGVGAWTLLRRASAVPWGTAVDAILFSHIYFGGWSSLMVRSWMYHAFYAVILVAAFGLLRMVRSPAIWWLIAVYAAFWAGQIYNVLMLYVSKGLPGSMGWYLYAVVAAEVALCAGGLARVRRWAPAAGVVLFALLDLYTVHGVAIPYYTGMIRHKASGAIAALHLADERAVGLHGALERLAVYKGGWISEPVFLGLWMAYLVATLWLMVGQALWPVNRGNAAAPLPNDEDFR
ncbi:MAG: glycosyltransferase family 39 protein [Acidobacteriia bacterium]|nr:glycosyltransferase family 39 protein [Terriglobia bacterium]